MVLATLPIDTVKVNYQVLNHGGNIALLPTTPTSPHAVRLLLASGVL